MNSFVRKMLLMTAIVAILSPQLMAQRCGGGNSVDLGNANLGQQLSFSGGGGGNDAALQAELAQLRQQVAAMSVNTGRQVTYQDDRTYMTYAPKEKLVNGKFTTPDRQPIPFQTVAMRRQASSSSSSAAALTQPGGALTFHEGARMEEIPPLPSGGCDEVAQMRAEMRAMMAELNALRSSSRSTMQYAAFQNVAAGGASSAASAASTAPSVNNLAITAPAVSRSSQSACSSGGCGGGGRARLLGGRRQVSRSRSFSSSTSR